MNKIKKIFKLLFSSGRKKTINQTNPVVFGEWFGKKCCDNCLFFANYLASIDSEFSLYWILENGCDDSRLSHSVTRVKKDSDEALALLKKARYIIVNQGLIDVISDTSFFPKYSYLINFWHGVAWKKIGADSLKSKFKAFYARLAYKKDGTDFYLSPSMEFSGKLKSSFGVNKQKVIEAGYPRNCFFYDNEKIKELKKTIISKYSLESDCIFLSYLPTFRDKDQSIVSMEKVVESTDFLSFLEKNKIYILQKMHFVREKGNLSVKSNSKRVINDFGLCAAEILAVSDILITDYSSCFFDYLVLNKPIIHFLYDYDYYRKDDRGLYYDINEVACGKVCFNNFELVESVKKYINNPLLDKELREKRRKKFMEFDTAQTNYNIYSFLKLLP